MVWDKCVSLKVARLLKKAGFNLECMSYYQHGIFYQYSVDKNKIVLCDYNAAPGYMEQFSAPTLATVQRWLMEVKSMNVLVDTFGYQHYEYFLDDFLKGEPFHEYNHIHIFKDYDSALEAGIQHALNLIIKDLQHE